MNIKSQAGTLSFAWQLLDNATSTKARIPFIAQKPHARLLGADDTRLPRCTPEEKGVSSDYLARYLKALDDDPTIETHGILILRGGAVIAEGSFGPYRNEVWRITHSQCKSLTGIAIGMLIDEGLLELDTPVSQVFERRGMSLSDRLHGELTVRHLLSMSSGTDFNEAGSVQESDWIKAFLSYPRGYEAGSRFTYDSMNTYLLSAIVSKITNMSLTDYLRPRLLEPLGIGELFWEKCPMGLDKGGWGCYIHPESIAKIGQMMLDGGVWEGQRIVSEEWVRAMTSLQFETGEVSPYFDYGFQVWVGRGVNSFLFSGLFSQNMLCYPDNDLIIVTTASNNEIFQQSNFFPVSNEFFGKPLERGSDEPLPADAGATDALELVCAGLGGKDRYTRDTWTPFAAAWERDAEAAGEAGAAAASATAGEAGAETEPCEAEPLTGGESCGAAPNPPTLQKLFVGSPAAAEKGAQLAAAIAEQRAEAGKGRRSWRSLFGHKEGAHTAHATGSADVSTTPEPEPAQKPEPTSSAPLALPDGCFDHADERYLFDERDCHGVGVLPIFMQSIQNNFTEGIDSLGFSIEDGRFIIEIAEGSDLHRFAVGFNAPEYGELSFSGEPYLIAAEGRFTTNEDDIEVLKIRISFLEATNSRLIKIFFLPGKVKVSLTERPGRDFLTASLGVLMQDASNLPGAGRFMSHREVEGFLNYKLSTGLEPEIWGSLA